eukprot:m.92344 g.92344  ORF g.92344 m.92344 type:complete len:186 (+) comp26539_c1_seq2:1141-1698(+)
MNAVHAYSVASYCDTNEDECIRTDSPQTSIESSSFDHTGVRQNTSVFVSNQSNIPASHQFTSQQFASVRIYGGDDTNNTNTDNDGDDIDNSAAYDNSISSRNTGAIIGNTTVAKNNSETAASTSTPLVLDHADNSINPTHCTSSHHICSEAHPIDNEPHRIDNESSVQFDYESYYKEKVFLQTTL